MRVAFTAIPWLVLAGISVLEAVAVQASARLTVKRDAVPLYSEMSRQSKVLRSLAKGERVAVEFEIVGGGEAWCAIREAGAALGYVPCADLAPREEKKAPPVARIAPSERQSPAPAPPGKAGQLLIRPTPGAKLIGAIERRDRAAVRQLLAQGVDPNARGMFDYSALSYAAEHCDAEMVRLLLAAGADVNDQKNAYGHTPLMAAVNCPYETIPLLLSAGADVNAQAALDGHTALMMAARIGYMVAVKHLLDAGARVEITDKQGKGALDYAKNNKVRGLLETGGRVLRTR